MKKLLLFLTVATLSIVGCKREDELFEQQKETLSPLEEKFHKAGFYTHNLVKTEDGYLVEGDIYFTEESLDQFLKEKEGDATSRYVTNNLVSGTRSIKVAVDPNLPQLVKNGVTEAIGRYNSLGLRINFALVSSGQDILIKGVGSGSFLAAAGFPTGGNPYNTVDVNTAYVANGSINATNVATIIAHEIGHCIGFRHTDYYNRAISGCLPFFANEGVTEIGANLVTGTNGDARFDQSWMLACVGTQNRPFTAEDIKALNFVYGIDKLSLSRWVSGSGVYTSDQRWLSGDFNNDGKTDVARISNDGGNASIDVFISNGTAFTQSRWATRQGVFTADQKWMVGDFNGDGKDDLAKAFNENGQGAVDVHVSNGSSFSQSRFISNSGGFSAEQKWIAGDYNGDGKSDVARAYYGWWWQTNIDVLVSNGSKFTKANWASQQGGFWDDQKWMSGDFNGDGKDDLAKAFNENNQGAVDVHISSGSSFSISRWISNSGSYTSEQKWIAGDINKDGKAEVIRILNDYSKSSIDVMSSTGGNGFNSTTRWATKLGGFSADQNWMIGDFSGNGKMGLAKAFGENSQGAIDVYFQK
ncbi:MAG: hypothetical protein C4K58_04685 [Flavobacteriaceae bacterium]|nr:MAG: hypothetical protein C4K58_04685 [Flavobacteriaceae bacterium]